MIIKVSFFNCSQLNVSESRHVVTLYPLISYPRASRVSDTGQVLRGLLTCRYNPFYLYCIIGQVA